LGVHKTNRVVIGVGISVDAAPQTNRVTLDVLSGEPVVVAVDVLIQPGLSIVVLAWEAQVVGNSKKGQTNDEYHDKNGGPNELTGREETSSSRDSLSARRLVED
jgi:hypothetical protein